MPTVSATHAKQNFAAMLDQSQREPVRIQRHDRDVAVLVSADEYEKIHKLRVQEPKALLKGRMLISPATFAELQAVLRRPKFVPYIQPGSVEPFLEEILSVAIQVAILSPIRACRDPKDDKFLEVAVHGRADAIVTGDADLLDLNPFRGIAILTPREYVERT